MFDHSNPSQQIDDSIEALEPLIKLESVEYPAEKYLLLEDKIFIMYSALSSVDAAALLNEKARWVRVYYKLEG